MHSFRSRLGLAAGLLTGAAVLAQQPGTSPYDLRSAWVPPSGYVGLNLGRPSYRLDCGPAGCDQPELSAQVYVGGMFSRHLGAELGYLRMGEAGRGSGAEVRAEGVNFSLVGRADIGAGVGLVGRLGTTWGRTRMAAPPGSGLATGRASGWGPSYGLGLDWAFSDNWSAVLDWQRHRFDFAGDDNGWVRSTSIGLKYRF